MATVFLPHSYDPPAALVAQCAWCERLRLGHRWVDEQQHSLRRDALTHTACPTCIAELRRTGRSR